MTLDTFAVEEKCRKPELEKLGDDQGGRGREFVSVLCVSAPCYGVKFCWNFFFGSVLFGGGRDVRSTSLRKLIQDTDADLDGNEG